LKVSRLHSPLGACHWPDANPPAGLAFVYFVCFVVDSSAWFRLRACLKMVASAILADVEPGLPARRNGVATGKVMVKCERFDRWTVFPGGKMPPFTAGKDAAL